MNKEELKEKLIRIANYQSLPHLKAIDMDLAIYADEARYLAGLIQGEENKNALSEDKGVIAGEGSQE